jgi:hypothetical protein
MKNPKEITLETIEWESPEYIHRDHSNDWFWGLGLITLLSVIIAICKGNYIFGIFLLLAGFSLILFSIKRPEINKNKIETKGLSIQGTFYQWSFLKSFNIKDTRDDNLFKLLIESNKRFLPILTVLVPKEIEEKVEDNLSKVMKKSNIDETGSTVFMDKIGF